MYLALLKIPKAISVLSQKKKKKNKTKKKKKKTKQKKKKRSNNNNKKATVATILIPLAEVQLTGCFATFSSTSLTWEDRGGTTLCWPIGHDHSSLILNIFLLIYFHA